MGFFGCEMLEERGYLFPEYFCKFSKERVSQKALEQKFGTISKAGTLLMSFKLTVGRTSILDIDALHNEAIISIFPYVDKNDFFRDYLFYIPPIITQWGESKNAIQGKLVEQRPEEGTAEELYQQIQEEKQKLIKEGKIKKEKPLAEITEDEIPFDIPDNWMWANCGDLFSIIRGSLPRPKGSPLYWSTEETEYNWITIRDISSFCNHGYLYKTYEYLTKRGSELGTFVEKDDLIIAVSGSTTGKHCLLGIEGYIYDGLAAVINTTKIIAKEYILLYFDWMYEKLNSQKVGSAFPNINTDILKNSLFPLPPLEEQKRIVAKIDELLPYCEKLIK